MKNNEIFELEDLHYVKYNYLNVPPSKIYSFIDFTVIDEIEYAIFSTIDGATAYNNMPHRLYIEKLSQFIYRVSNNGMPNDNAFMYNFYGNPYIDSGKIVNPDGKWIKYSQRIFKFKDINDQVLYNLTYGC